MAGQLSIGLARRQGAHLNCADAFALLDELDNQLAFADLHPGDPTALKEYWTHGKGALKIRWGTDGSFRRCVRLLRRHFPKNPEGLCANLHHQATGEWPTEGGKAGLPS